MAFGRRGRIQQDQARALAQAQPQDSGGLGSTLTPEPTGGSAGAQRLFGAGMGGGRGTNRTAIPQGQQFQQAPPAMGGGKAGGGKAGGGKAKPLPKYGSRQGGGMGGAPPAQGQPAPSYGAGKGNKRAPMTGTQRKALPNMQNKVAPMGGSSGQI